MSSSITQFNTTLRLAPPLSLEGELTINKYYQNSQSRVRKPPIAIKCRLYNPPNFVRIGWGCNNLRLVLIIVIFLTIYVYGIGQWIFLIMK